MAFKPHPLFEQRKRSAVALIKYLLADENPAVLPAHRRELITIMLWKITEAESLHKHKTRLKTKKAISCTDKRSLRHEHVFPRAKMIDALENAKPHEIDDILANAIGCTVTVDEHLLLAAFKDESGWERYRRAGLTVIDTATGERIT
jgi:hypothetical protein